MCRFSTNFYFFVCAIFAYVECRMPNVGPNLTHVTKSWFNNLSITLYIMFLSYYMTGIVVSSERRRALDVLQGRSQDVDFLSSAQLATVLRALFWSTTNQPMTSSVTSSETSSTSSSRVDQRRRRQFRRRHRNSRRRHRRGRPRRHRNNSNSVAARSAELQRLARLALERHLRPSHDHA